MTLCAPSQPCQKVSEMLYDQKKKGEGDTYQCVLGLVHLLLAVLHRGHRHGIRCRILGGFFIDLDALDLALVLDRRGGPQLAHHHGVQPRLVENDVRLVADFRLLVGRILCPLDPLGPVLRLGPKRNLEHMVRLLEQVLGDAKAVKDLDRPRLHAVGLANLERAVAALKHLVADAETGQPDGRTEARRPAAADEDVDFLGFGRHGVVVAVGMRFGKFYKLWSSTIEAEAS